MAIAEIQDVVVVRKQILFAVEGLMHRIDQAFGQCRIDQRIDEASKIAGRRGDHQFFLVRSRLARFAVERAVRQSDDITQLTEDRGCKLVRLLVREDMRRRSNDPRQTKPVTLDLHHVAVGTQGRVHHRAQLLRSQFSLVLVIVDVVIGYHLMLRRLSRLPGTQDDAHEMIVQFLAHEFDDIQTRLIALHDHVEQQNGDIVGLAQ